MLRQGILNPALLSLLARVRHTNTLVIADRGFPSWPGLETVDLSLTDNLPTVAQVIAALRPNFVIGRVFAARELHEANAQAPEALARHLAALEGLPLVLEPHIEFKLRVPRAVGLIRTADTVQYGNVILESA
jgi:D-ribose pyranase